MVILSRIFGVNGLACSQATADICSMLIAIPMVVTQMKAIKVLPDGAEPPAGLRRRSKASEIAPSEAKKPAEVVPPVRIEENAAEQELDSGADSDL